MRTISKDRYLEAAQLFHWATKEHFVLWFTGRSDRHKRSEVVLPRLVKRGQLIAKRFGKRLVYAAPRYGKSKLEYPFLEHGLGATEGLVRFWRSDMDSTIYPERLFRGGDIVPEWGIKNADGKLLLFEFCTRSNFYKAGNISSKVARYEKNFADFLMRYGGEPIVLFVVAIQKSELEGWFRKNMPIGERFYFTDYESFLSVPIGEQLITDIYIWGADGNYYPLKSS